MWSSVDLDVEAVSRSLGVARGGQVDVAEVGTGHPKLGNTDVDLRAVAAARGVGRRLHLRDGYGSAGQDIRLHDGHGRRERQTVDAVLACLVGQMRGDVRVRDAVRVRAYSALSRDVGVGLG